MSGAKYPTPLIPATSAATKTREFTVSIEEDEGTFVARCDGLPRWTAVASSVEELKRLAFDGIKFCLDDPSVTIVVHWSGRPA